MDNLVNWLKKGGAELPKMEMVYFFKNFRGAAATKKIFVNYSIYISQISKGIHFYMFLTTY